MARSAGRGQGGADAPAVWWFDVEQAGTRCLALDKEEQARAN
jgi:hypothetical protein